MADIVVAIGAFYFVIMIVGMWLEDYTTVIYMGLIVTIAIIGTYLIDCQSQVLNETLTCASYADIEEDIYIGYGAVTAVWLIVEIPKRVIRAIMGRGY